MWPEPPHTCSDRGQLATDPSASCDNAGMGSGRWNRYRNKHKPPHEPLPGPSPGPPPQSAPEASATGASMPMEAIMASNRKARQLSPKEIAVLLIASALTVGGLMPDDLLFVTLMLLAAWAGFVYLCFSHATTWRGRIVSSIILTAVLCSICARAYKHEARHALEVSALVAPSVPIPYASIPAPGFVFQDSPLLTSARKRRIVYDLQRFRGYLSALGLVLDSAPFPPFGVDPAGVTGDDSVISGNNPHYYDSLKIAPTDIDNRMQITQLYCKYSIDHFLNASSGESVGGSSSGHNAKSLIGMEFRGTKLRLSCAVFPPDFRRDPNRRAPSIFTGWHDHVTLLPCVPGGHLDQNPRPTKTNQIHPQTKTITNQDSTTMTNQDHLETKNQPKPTDVNAAAGNGVWPPRGLRRSFRRRPRAAQFPADHPRIPLTTQ